MKSKKTNWNAIRRGDLRLGAIHEAGHAVVAAHFGIGTEILFLPPGKPSVENRDVMGRLLIHESPHSTGFRNAVIGFAGYAASILAEAPTADEFNCWDYLGGGDWLEDEMSATDVEMVRQTVQKWRALRTACRILKKRWRQVEEVAEGYERQALEIRGMKWRRRKLT